MNEWFPEMMDKPDSQMVGTGLAYIMAMFLILPFFLLIFALDAFESETVQTWLEFGFHVLSFVICVSVFRSHLSDSLRTARQDLKKFFTVTGICLALSVAVLVGYYSYWLFLCDDPTANSASIGLYYTVPMTEKNLLTYPLDMLMTNSQLALPCMAVLTPVSISCLYYGAGFAPVCYRNPWLAYLAVAALIALPRIANCFTFRWISQMEMTLYFTQLPLHFLACYSYQKTESILAPILIHSVMNLLGCFAMMALILL